MKFKTYSTTKLRRIADSLSTSYWYKSGLKKFLARAGVSWAIISSLNWEKTKRQTVRALLLKLASVPEKGAPLLNSIATLLEGQNARFEHLLNLEDAAKLIKKAQRALRRLKAILRDKRSLIAPVKSLRRGANRFSSPFHSSIPMRIN